MDPKPRHQEPRYFFRVHGPDSCTFFDSDIGFFSARSIRDGDLGEPSKEDFKAHMEGDHFVGHEEREPFASPFMSLTDSPWRALRFGGVVRLADVSIIDAVKLRAARIAVERTTTLADHYGIVPRYTTESHWLARPWIPWYCIDRSVPFDRFEEVCNESGISRAMPKEEAIAKIFDIKVFEKRRDLVGFGVRDLAAQIENISLN